MADRISVPIATEDDIVKARGHCRALARHLGFPPADLIFIVTAVTEVASNLLAHSREGEIHLELDSRDGEEALVIVGQDRGPGISDVEHALEVGFSTTDGMGIGLPGARSLMHEFDIQSQVGTGTHVTAKRWLARVQ
jgi:serine/threonine-protein kinase RsbT